MGWHTPCRWLARGFISKCVAMVSECGGNPDLSGHAALGLEPPPQKAPSLFANGSLCRRTPTPLRSRHKSPPPADEGGDLVHAVVGGGHGLGGGSGLGGKCAGAVASGIIGKGMAGAQDSGEIFFNDRCQLSGEVVGEGPLVLAGGTGVGEGGFA
jgi:hypothetical protein